jgi:asparagine synthase (glutamine-hydrolysing)
MSIIFGIRQPPGMHVEATHMQTFARATECYAPYGTVIRTSERVGMVFQPIPTSKRHDLEQQPLLDEIGNMLCFDGRIDNHDELREELHLGHEASDSMLVLASYRRWGERCFSHLIGEWALGLWSQTNRLLYLARDHAGSRTLYYENANGSIRWSTYLETLLGLDPTRHSLSSKYAAAYLGSLPIRELTPYAGILAVPPAHYLVFAEKETATRRHWDPEAKDSIRFVSDSDYEQRFRELFATAVARRTQPEDPILAHLSGGMDSTSIVCMSDALRRTEKGPSCELLDTLSLYNDSEPSWNEKPYFSLVEATRGKSGIHVEISSDEITFESVDQSVAVYPLPGADTGSFRREKRMADLFRPRGYRAIVTGHGGDELLGGVPTPLPELADYLAAGSFGQLVRKATSWCLTERRSLLKMLSETAAYTAATHRTPRTDDLNLSPWLHPKLRELNLEHSGGPCFGFRLTRLAPSHIGNGRLWTSLLETLPHLFASAIRRYEYRYPYLDRDLVDFLFRIPREQLVRPGRRRSLMRRALQGIVPTEVLERRRKAVLSRGRLSCLEFARPHLHTMFKDSLLAEYGWIDSAKLLQALDQAVAGNTPAHCGALMKTIGLELWLRSKQTGVRSEQAVLR